MILTISLISSLHVLHGFNLCVGQNGEILEHRRWQAKDLPMDCLHPAGLHRRGSCRILLGWSEVGEM